MMTKQALTDLILEKKTELGLSWADIASGVGLSPTFLTSACLGMNSLKPEFADKLVGILELPAEAKAAIEACPMKTWEQTVPTDPLIYRIYEVMGVYGPTMKELIHEEFGDGIMSAIDFEVSVDKEPHPEGDHVVITYDGKFLPYKRW